MKLSFSSLQLLKILTCAAAGFGLSTLRPSPGETGTGTGTRSDAVSSPDHLKPRPASPPQSARGTGQMPPLEILTALQTAAAGGDVPGAASLLNTVWKKARQEVHLALVNEYGPAFSHLLPPDDPAAGQPGDWLMTLARTDPLAALRQADSHPRYLAKFVRNRIYAIWAESDPFTALAHFQQTLPPRHPQNLPEAAGQSFSHATTGSYLSVLAFLKDPEKFKTAGLTVAAESLDDIGPDQWSFLATEVTRSKDTLLHADPALAKTLFEKYAHELAVSMAPELSPAEIAAASERYGIPAWQLTRAAGRHAVDTGNMTALTELFKVMGPGAGLDQEALSLLTPDQIGTLIRAQETPDQQQKLRTIFGTHFAEQNPHEVFLNAGTDAYWSPGERIAALGKLAETDPETALQWMAQPGNPLDNSPPESVERVYARLASQDPEAALQMSDRLTDPAVQKRVQEHLVATWIRESPLECSTYLNTLPEGPVRDTGAGVVAATMVKEDPDTSLIWLQAISDKTARSVILQRMTFDDYRAFMAAESFAALPDERKQEIQKRLPASPP